jgi:tRNA 5-methylaminomethyl-2-thiouridine biosynthesis bifunctional protein
MSWGPVAAGEGELDNLPADLLVQAAGLPQRWARLARFVVLETGFGVGERFLEIWARWRADPQRCERLYVLASTARPPSQAGLARALRDNPHPGLAEALLANWPAATPDLHLLEFDAGQVQLHLAFGAMADVLRQWVAQVDAFFLTGPYPHAESELRWADRLKPLARLAAPSATVVAWGAADGIDQALRPLGFEVDTRTSPPLLTGRFAPRHVTNVPPGRQACGARSVVVIGAGLAGAAAARALAEHGLQVTVAEQHHPASGASGNGQGLYHPLLHGADSLHARWFRACAALAHAQHASEEPASTAAGLLRLEFEAPLAEMQSLLAAQGLPESFARALSAQEASHRAGLPLKQPAWWFRQAGAVSPKAKVLRDLATPGVGLMTAQVAQLVFDEATSSWRLLDAHGKVVAEAAAVVLANGQHAQALWPSATWPQRLWRGQTSTLANAEALGLPLPALPVGGMGYACALGEALFMGATNQAGDPDDHVRLADHQENLARYAQLCGLPAALWQGLAEQCDGRTGWRVAVPGRLPVLGPVPLAHAEAGHRSDSPRLVARAPGLYVLSALASRGLTQAPLAARILAAWITGAPQPVAAPLLDAVDVARFTVANRT